MTTAPFPPGLSSPRAIHLLFFCSFAMRASFTKTNDRKGEFSPVCPFWICEQWVRKVDLLFSLFFLFWISLEEFLRTKKTKIISHGFAQSLSQHLTWARTLGQELAPQRLAERKKGKLIGKDALTLTPVCSVPQASPLLEETLKNLPIISTLWAESQKEQTRPPALWVQWHLNSIGFHPLAFRWLTKTLIFRKFEI